MALLNPSFEDEGALPSEADHWTLTAVTSLEVLAGFGTAPEDAWEDLERWFTLLASLDDVTVVLAFFDTVAEGHEDFEEGWANAVYLHELPPAQLVTCAFGGGAVEDCETGWSNVPYLRNWALVTALRQEYCVVWALCKLYGSDDGAGSLWNSFQRSIDYLSSPHGPSARRGLSRPKVDSTKHRPSWVNMTR